MKLKLYMKSGNTLTFINVKGWAYKYNDEEITYLKVTPKNGLLGKPKSMGVQIKSIILSQIEAIEELK